MEGEIQRRKEHLNEATNFQEARGFVRSNWKTKNWNPNQDPTQQDSSTDSEDEAVVYKDERRDTVKENFASPNRVLSDSEERDHMNETPAADGWMNNSNNLTHQFSEQKNRKRRQ